MLMLQDDIVADFNNGDEKAFTIIYKHYFPIVYSYAKNWIDSEQAKDVTSAVFIDLWKGERKLENKLHLISLLRIMTRNKCIDVLRKDKKQHDHLEKLSYLSESREEIIFSEAFLGAGIYRHIREEIEKLPPHMREVFKLSFYEGLKNGEIAKKLQLKDASVRVLKAQALKLLRSALFDIELGLLLIFLKNIK